VFVLVASPASFVFCLIFLERPEERKRRGRKKEKRREEKRREEKRR
jgi:hypothetical protein